MKQVVKQPTRGRNTLDLIFTNIAEFYEYPEALAPLSTSDHRVIKWNSKCSAAEKKGNKIKIKVRPITAQQVMFLTLCCTTLIGLQCLVLRITMKKLMSFNELLKA